MTTRYALVLAVVQYEVDAQGEAIDGTPHAVEQTQLASYAEMWEAEAQYNILLQDTDEDTAVPEGTLLN